MSWGDETWKGRYDWHEYVPPINPRPSGYESGSMMASVGWCMENQHSWVPFTTQVAGVGVRCRHCHKEVKTFVNSKLPPWLDFIDAAQRGMELPGE